MKKWYIRYVGNLSAIDADDDDTVYPEDFSENPPSTGDYSHENGYGIEWIWYEYDTNEAGKLVNGRPWYPNRS